MEDPHNLDDLDELDELDPNDDQAVLQPETRYKQKFLTTEYAASSSGLLFFQMLNNKEPEGTTLASLDLSVVFTETFQLLLFDVLTYLHLIFFSGFQSFTGRILALLQTKDKDFYKTKIDLQYWLCSGGHGISGLSFFTHSILYCPRHLGLKSHFTSSQQSIG